MSEAVVSRRAFFGVAALLFAVSVAMTGAWSASMSTMGEMAMPGGWSMSRAWMRMPGQTWSGAAASFVGMWVAMMAAMMLPSLIPTLWRYGQTAGKSIALVGGGYFLVWAALGAALFPLGVGLTALEMRDPGVARAVPVMTGVVIFVAGTLQFTGWKTRQLTCWREGPWRHGPVPADAVTAVRRGVRSALHCGSSSAGLTAVLLAAGVMDLRVMAAVGIAITAERLTPVDGWIVRGIGIVVVGAGLIAITRATGFA